MNMHDSEDQALLDSLSAETLLSEGEPTQYQFHGLVVHADLANTWKKFVKEHEDGYYFITTYHGAAELGEPCHQVYGKHMHILFILPNAKMYNSSSIHNRFVRRHRQFKKCLYAHEKARNLVGLYRYITTPPRCVVQALTRLPSWFDEYILSLTNPISFPEPAILGKETKALG
jgi:hypothetical protein